MSIPAPKKIQGIPPRGETDKIVHLPDEERNWRARVVEHTRKIVPWHTTEQATPSAAQEIIEFPTPEDVKRNVGAIFHEEGSEKHVGIIPSKNFAKRVIARARSKLGGLKKAA